MLTPIPMLPATEAADTGGRGYGRGRGGPSALSPSPSGSIPALLRGTAEPLAPHLPCYQCPDSLGAYHEGPASPYPVLSVAASHLGCDHYAIGPELNALALDLVGVGLPFLGGGSLLLTHFSSS